MKHAEDYRVLITEQNQVVFIIRNQDRAPKEPYLVYNGGKHALLHRSPHDALLLDFLPDDIAYLLKYATEVLIIEAYFETNEVTYDYKVSVTYTPN